MNKEMQKLQSALNAKGYKWEDASDELIRRVHFVNKNNDHCSVIFGERFTYGGRDGLLETMPPVHNIQDDSVEGWLTADEIIAAWL